MPPEFDRIQLFFKSWLDVHDSEGPAGQVAAWLAAGGFEPTEFREISNSYSGVREAWFHHAMPDLVLAYAASRLDQDPSLAAHVIDVRLIRSLLHIEDGELYRLRPTEVEAIVASVFEEVLRDDVIDVWEDLLLVDVQAALGLGYDQLLAAARPSLEHAMTRMQAGLSVEASASARQSVMVRIAELEPTYLAAQQA